MSGVGGQSGPAGSFDYFDCKSNDITNDFLSYSHSCCCTNCCKPFDYFDCKSNDITNDFLIWIER
jgi:hypothetical protein